MEPLPQKSCDEIPSDQLEAVVLIDDSEATTNVPTDATATTASERDWMEKRIMGIRYRTIVAIICIIFLLYFIVSMVVLYRDHRHNITHPNRRWLDRLENYFLHAFPWILLIFSVISRDFHPKQSCVHSSAFFVGQCVAFIIVLVYISVTE